MVFGTLGKTDAWTPNFHYYPPLDSYTISLFLIARAAILISCLFWTLVRLAEARRWEIEKEKYPGEWLGA